ncbi:hypothetical protein DL98DRAFT_442935 [Cadophora sp. DSE1049]|nr:hypothetical protein DL98DRAFT_442935 [Cadophora sp. DSE1049]
MSKHPKLIAPRDSFINPRINPPISPPLNAPSTKPSDRVSQIIKQLHLRKASCEASSQPWIVFPLQPGEFELLVPLLKADQPLWSFFKDSRFAKRCDYFSRSRRFVLRMPTAAQEFFRSSVVLDIQEQFGKLAAGTDDAAEFARNVRYRGSPRLYFPADKVAGGSGDNDDRAQSHYDTHEPDAVFKHIDAQWPCIVIEVSSSEKEKELNDLAEDYILGSDGNIPCVVGLNIEYKQSKKATFSVWQPQYIEHDDGQECLVSAQTVFRDELGNLSGDKGLEIQLKVLANKDLINNSPSAITQRIFISPSTLYDFVTRAEADDEKVKEKRGKMSPLKPGAKKLRRQRTQREESKLDDE